MAGIRFLLVISILLANTLYTYSTVLPTVPQETTTPAPLAENAPKDGNQTTATPTNTSAQPEQPDLHARLAQSRIMRLYTLRQHILDTLGWENPPVIDPETKRQLLLRMNTPVYVTRQKFCYYAMCDLPMVDLPDYMNRSIWFDTSSRNIRYYFDLEASDDPDTEITSAVLRLHLKRREDCPCAFEGDPSTSRLHIKIYQYRKPVRSISRLRHSNMRLIDAKMVTWDSARWVSLQVTDAVKRIITRGRRNGGFEVHVRDMEETVLDAKTIIDPTVCSSATVYDCTHDEANNMFTDSVDEIDPNYSPVLEISSTTTRRIPIS